MVPPAVPSVSPKTADETGGGGCNAPQACSSHPCLRTVVARGGNNCKSALAYSGGNKLFSRKQRAKKQGSGSEQYSSYTDCVCCSGSVATVVATFSEFSDKIITFICSGDIYEAATYKGALRKFPFSCKQSELKTVGVCELPTQKYV